MSLRTRPERSQGGSDAPVTPLAVAPTTEAPSSARFACPFVKRYGPLGVKGYACTGKGWLSAHRVKYVSAAVHSQGSKGLTCGAPREHLYRRHKPRITCPRCRMEFMQREEVEPHLNKEQICDRKPPADTDQPTALTDAQVTELKRRNSKLNEVEQWKGIYKIIFPNEQNIPSPC